MTHNAQLFPACFSEAGFKLRAKFRNVDNATIEDSVEYARIQYWFKHKEEQFRDDGEALGWLLKVAHRYLYKEVKRLKRQSSIYGAVNVSSGIDIERQFIYDDILGSLNNKITQKPIFSTVIMRGIGYSLKELAESENISLSAMKQRHARERRIAYKKVEHLFH